MTVPPPPINPIITIQPLTAVGVPHDSDATGALAGAKHGDVIQGFVVNRDGNQNPILRTPLGDILVKSDIFLKAGSEVQIRVDVQLASRARIIMIDGHSPETYVKLNVQTQAPRADVILQSSILSQQRMAAAQSATNSGITDADLPVLAGVVLRHDGSGIKELLNLQTPTAQARTQKMSGVPLPSQLQAMQARIPAGTQVQVTIIGGALPAAVSSAGDTIAQLLTPTLGTQTQPAPQQPAQALPQNIQQQSQPLAAQVPAQPAATQNAAAIIDKNPQTTLTPQAPAAGAVATQTIIPTAAGTPQPAQAAQTNPLPPAATSNLSAQDIQALLQTATTPQIRAQQLPHALQNPALAAQTLGQEETPSHLPAAQHLPSSYRPFAGAHVIQQAPAQPGTPQAAQAQQTPFLGTAHIPQAPTIPIHNPANNATPIATQPQQQPATPRGELMQVIGHEPDGGTIVKGEHSTLKLFTAKPLPTGTTLMVEVGQPNMPRPINAAIPSRLVEFSNLASHWPALEDALSTLGQQLPPGQQPVPPSALIPNIGPRFTHEVMLFLSVVRGGDFNKLWPSQVIKQLEESRPELLQRLQLDMGNMQQLAQPAQPQQQWSVYLIPMLFGNEAQHMRLFVRSDDSEKNKEDSVHNQRFIMEIALSNLGDMQLDGFVQGGKRPTQFDLVIRTAKTLPDAVEADISRLFSGAIESTRLKGRIMFQTGREYFITPATQIGPAQQSSDGDFTLLA